MGLASLSHKKKRTKYMRTSSESENKDYCLYSKYIFIEHFAHLSDDVNLTHFVVAIIETVATVYIPWSHCPYGRVCDVNIHANYIRTISSFDFQNTFARKSFRTRIQ